jgi:hypothetical protein
MKLPHIIAICGYPGAGKTEVQKILAEVGVQFADDGFPMRDFAMRHLGLTHNDVYTQEGKTDVSEIAGAYWQNRKILGELGNKFEELFGPHIMPFMATRKLIEVASYSFGSVRRDQGAFYKNLGGVVIGVTRPGVGPSGNEFDEFDHAIVDYWIRNDGSLDDLRFKVEMFLQWVQFSNSIKMAA